MYFTILGSQGSRIIWDHEENMEGIKDIVNQQRQIWVI